MRNLLFIGLLGLLFVSCGKDEITEIHELKAISTKKLLCINHDNGLGCESILFPEGTSLATHTFITYVMDDEYDWEYELPVDTYFQSGAFSMDATITDISVIFCSRRTNDPDFDDTACFTFKVVAIPIN